MSLKLDYAEVEAYIKEYGNAQTRYYLGSDSCRYKRNGQWWASYTLCIVVHRHTEGGVGTGCKVFGEEIVERDHDQQKNKPALRLMRECVLLSEFFLKLKDLLEDKMFVELHLDINKTPGTGSNFIVQQAVGYLQGICGHHAVVCSKPDSPAASFCSDRLLEILVPTTLDNSL